MKSIRINRPTKSLLLYTLAIMMFISLASCNKKIMFLTSATVPAARGYVEYKSDKNKNFDIHINVTNLAEVNRLQPAKQAYVVWMETDHQVVKNLGQINSSSGSFSKQLKASFETVSAFKPVKIFITAEDDSNVQYPGAQYILTTAVF